MEHTAIPQGEIHSPYQWIVADIAARDAIAPAPTDVDKLCLQRSDRRVFRLLSVAPITWEADHLHAAADIMGLGTAASLDAASGGDAADDELVLGNDSRLTNPRQPTEHRHAASDLDGLGTAATLNVAVSGNAGPGEVVKGSDTRLIDARTPTAHQHAVAEVTGLSTVATTGSYNDLANKPDLSLKADLVAGKIPAGQLPSFVDDVLEFANLAAFPATGESGKQYVAINSATAADPSKIYRWSGTVYTEISPSPGSTSDVPEGSNLYHTPARAAAAAPVQSVAGYVGAVSAEQIRGALPAAVAAGASGLMTGADKTKLDATASQTELAAKAPLANPSFTGDLTLSSVGARIRGDFSNATAASRVAFQSSVTNGATNIPALPNGTSTSVSHVFYNGIDPENAQRGYIGISSTRVFTGSNYSGSPGVALPYEIDVGGANRVRILPTGEVGIGVTPAVGLGTLQVQNVNGAATSGFRNKIINGCCRISRKGSGAAALGWNQIGADGISTHISKWSAVTGTIGVENAADFSMTSSGGAHVTNITAATGSFGDITHVVRIEAADALELAGRPFTVSARITSWTKQIDGVLINILKANTVNNFGATTFVANSAWLEPVSADTTKDVSFSTTLTTADCANGLQIEFKCYYSSAVTAAFHCFIADMQCCAGSQRMPFELRPIAIEEQLRERYWKVLQVWVPTSSSRATAKIGMHKTPTISGGGTGFVSTGTDKDNLVCYQTTAALQTITLNAEL